MLPEVEGPPCAARHAPPDLYIRSSMTSRFAGVAVVLAIRAAIAPALATQYLCIPDKATGFSYNKTTKEWESKALKTSQFVISPSKQENTALDIKGIGTNGERLPGFVLRISIMGCFFAIRSAAIFQ